MAFLVVVMVVDILERQQTANLRATLSIFIKMMWLKLSIRKRQKEWKLEISLGIQNQYVILK